MSPSRGTEKMNGGGKRSGGAGRGRTPPAELRHLTKIARFNLNILSLLEKSPRGPDPFCDSVLSALFCPHDQGYSSAEACALTLYRVLESRKGEVACFSSPFSVGKHATSPFLDSNTRYTQLDTACLSVASSVTKENPSQPQTQVNTRHCCNREPLPTAAI